MMGSTQAATGARTTNGAKNAKRAAWEEFGFMDLPNGNVRVCNHSHGKDAGEHVYEVETDADGTATGCACPHHEYRDERCKHMIAVDGRAAASAEESGSDGEGEDGKVAVVMAANGTNETLSENDLRTLRSALETEYLHQNDADRSHLAEDAWDLRERMNALFDG